MASRIVLVTLFILCSIFNHNNVGARKLSRKEDQELDEQLKLLNKPAVKTINTDYGDIYNCIDFYKQPGFDHPNLKNHSFHFQMKPSFLPKEVISDNDYAETQKPQHVLLNRVGCPVGTVPIRRTTKDDLIRERLVSERYANSNIHPLSQDDPGLHYAGFDTRPRTYTEYHGAGASLSLYNPHVTTRQYSSSLVMVENGGEFIKAGWMVDISLYPDSRTRLFTYLNGATTSCYNARCGFILVNADIPLDLPFNNLSVRGKILYEVKIFFYRDRINGNWWLYVGDEAVGFWPKRLFNSLGKPATYVYWGGEVRSPPNVGGPPMGSGEIPVGDPNDDSYCRRISVVSEANKYVYPSEAFPSVDRVAIPYDTVFFGKTKGDWAYTILFGGPGGVTGD